MRVEEQVAPPREGGVGSLSIKNCFISLLFFSTLPSFVFFFFFNSVKVFRAFISWQNIMAKLKTWTQFKARLS